MQDTFENSRPADYKRHEIKGIKSAKAYKKTSKGGFSIKTTKISERAKHRTITPTSLVSVIPLQINKENKWMLEQIIPEREG